MRPAWIAIASAVGHAGSRVMTLALVMRRSAVTFVSLSLWERGLAGPLQREGAG
jgi:hypothetical protein